MCVRTSVAVVRESNNGANTQEDKSHENNMLYRHVGLHPQHVAKRVAHRDFRNWLSQAKTAVIAHLQGPVDCVTGSKHIVLFCQSGKHRSVSLGALLLDTSCCCVPFLCMHAQCSVFVRVRTHVMRSASKQTRSGADPHLAGGEPGICDGSGLSLQTLLEVRLQRLLHLPEPR